MRNERYETILSNLMSNYQKPNMAVSHTKQTIDVSYDQKPNMAVSHTKQTVDVSYDDVTREPNTWISKYSGQYSSYVSEQSASKYQYLTIEQFFFKVNGFPFNKFQKSFYENIVNEKNPNNINVVQWPRRSGATTFLATLACYASMLCGLNVAVAADVHSALYNITELTRKIQHTYISDPNYVRNCGRDPMFILANNDSLGFKMGNYYDYDYSPHDEYDIVIYDASRFQHEWFRRMTISNKTTAVRGIAIVAS